MAAWICRYICQRREISALYLRARRLWGCLQSCNSQLATPLRNTALASTIRKELASLSISIPLLHSLPVFLYCHLTPMYLTLLRSLHTITSPPLKVIPLLSSISLVLSSTTYPKLSGPSSTPIFSPSMTSSPRCPVSSFSCRPMCLTGSHTNPYGSPPASSPSVPCSGISCRLTSPVISRTSGTGSRTAGSTCRTTS